MWLEYFQSPLGLTELGQALWSVLAD